MEKFNVDYEKARQLAEKYFVKMKYHCSEASTRAILETLYGSADPILIKVSTSFMGGIAGTSQNICGAVSGGLIVLGSIFGRSEADVNDDLLAKIGKEYLENFTNAFEANSVNCDELRAKRETPSCAPYVEYAVIEALKLIEKFQN